MHGGEITRLGGDFDSILVASLLVASLPGGEMTSYLICTDKLSKDSHAMSFVQRLVVATFV